MESVNFKYPNGNVLIEDCNIKIKKNKITFFVGKTGTGKSTIIDLILGLQSPVSGKIYYDKDSLEEINIKTLRDKVGLVPQDPLLFNTSIKNNIKWANPQLSDSEILEILNKLDLDSFIKKLCSRIRDQCRRKRT